MAKTKALPPLTPRAREVLTHVINAVALGTHDNEGEIGRVAERLGTTPGRLATTLRRLEGWITVENGFVYPTPAALRWQNAALSDKDAKALLRQVKG